ncbi:MAG: acyltransferase, partial [Micrococcales bacterium]|nr:acyltransferase [Micrococcales bacterium]
MSQTGVVPVSAPVQPADAQARAAGQAAGARHGHRSPVRTDIQGLRALAVTVVVVFHLWPTVLGGGYVGVDVFFVVSGFLITGQLVRSPVRGPRDVAVFWARRIRRLIPAATFVLLVTMVAGVIWLPRTVRGAMGHDGVASALYVQNWRLATTEADYLSAEQMPSVVQHYWSLSIEEQFYVMWPLLLGLAAALATVVARRAGRDARTAVTLAVAVTVASAVVASLAWSVHLTRADPVRAYFVSTTRMWELAIGGLLAAVLAVAAVRQAPGRAWRHTPAVRAVVAWTGLVLIVVAAYQYDAATP